MGRYVGRSIKGIGRNGCREINAIFGLTISERCLYAGDERRQYTGIGSQRLGKRGMARLALSLPR